MAYSLFYKTKNPGSFSEDSDDSFEIIPDTNDIDERPNDFNNKNNYSDENSYDFLQDDSEDMTQEEKDVWNQKNELEGRSMNHNLQQLLQQELEQQRLEVKLKQDTEDELEDKLEQEVEMESEEKNEEECVHALQEKLNEVNIDSDGCEVLSEPLDLSEETNEELEEVESEEEFEQNNKREFNEVLPQEFQWDLCNHERENWDEEEKIQYQEFLEEVEQIEERESQEEIEDNIDPDECDFTIEPFDFPEETTLEQYTKARLDANVNDKVEEFYEKPEEEVENKSEEAFGYSWAHKTENWDEEEFKQDFNPEPRQELDYLWSDGRENWSEGEEFEQEFDIEQQQQLEYPLNPPNNRAENWNEEIQFEQGLNAEQQQELEYIWNNRTENWDEEEEFEQNFNTEQQQQVEYPPLNNRTENWDEEEQFEQGLNTEQQQELEYILNRTENWDEEEETQYQELPEEVEQIEERETQEVIEDNIDPDECEVLNQPLDLPVEAVAQRMNTLVIPRIVIDPPQVTEELIQRMNDSYPPQSYTELLNEITALHEDLLKKDETIADLEKQINENIQLNENIKGILEDYETEKALSEKLGQENNTLMTEARYMNAAYNKLLDQMLRMQEIHGTGEGSEKMCIRCCKPCQRYVITAPSGTVINYAASSCEMLAGLIKLDADDIKITLPSSSSSSSQ